MIIAVKFFFLRGIVKADRSQRINVTPGGNYVSLRPPSFAAKKRNKNLVGCDKKISCESKALK